MVKRLFGTNGIRGVFGQDLSIEFLIDIAFSIGYYFGKGPIVLGSDGRSSSLSISKIVSAVLMSMGIDVYQMGLTPTPCLQFTVKNSKMSGGIMITASHNPKEYNGLKPVSHLGFELSRDEEIKIESIYNQRSFLDKKYKAIGNLFDLNAFDQYINKVLTFVDREVIEKSKIRIVMDCGNGVQSVIAPLIARKLGCEVLIMNGNIDPNFSARGSEPKMENLLSLTKMVSENGYDLGVAYDGDGDRSIFCDEKGVIRWGDKTGSLLAYHLIKNKKLDTEIVCPINSSSVISRVGDLLDKRVHFTKVGSVEVTYGMKDTNSLIGFEENGGFFYGPLNLVRDGAITTALVIEMLSYYKQGFLADQVHDIDSPIKTQTLSSIYSILGETFQYKSSINLSSKDDIQRVLEACSKHGSVFKVEKVDGVKIWFDSESWIMFRPSGTEPLIRIYSESNDNSLMNSKVKEYLNLIKKLLNIEINI
ncbi:MAG TPA: phosphoglucosamine mutase [Nitrososphaeraceae archaeon]|nr:phosphoglucosamine mutase [Nitrososphaeraceae archaeon]